VLGGLDLIEDEIDTIQPAELKELLGIIRAGAERQHALSSKIVLHFELERVKAARPPNRVVCDAAATLVAAARLAAGYAGRSGDLTLIADPGTVPASQAHLNAAVSELAGNAFYFSKPGQPVTVTGTRHDAGYRIEVIDQGLGMTPEQCAAVGAFTQFGRGEQNQQGLGLGLAIARSVVEIAGGRFSLQSGPGGRGLHATLDFPCG
jgi:signal transduction histidine kinase